MNSVIPDQTCLICLFPFCSDSLFQCLKQAKSLHLLITKIPALFIIALTVTKIRTHNIFDLVRKDVHINSLYLNKGNHN